MSEFKKIILETEIDKFQSTNQYKTTIKLYFEALYDLTHKSYKTWTANYELELLSEPVRENSYPYPDYSYPQLPFGTPTFLLLQLDSRDARKLSLLYYDSVEERQTSLFQEKASFLGELISQGKIEEEINNSYSLYLFWIKLFMTTNITSWDILSQYPTDYIHKMINVLNKVNPNRC